MRIGLDIGGTKIEGIILDNNGDVVEVIRKPTPTSSYTDVLNTICAVVDKLQDISGSLLPVGIGTPGALSNTTQTIKNSNSTVFNGKPLLHDLQNRFDYEIRIENDANCLVLSEAHYGVAKDANVVFGVIIGTGTGGGIVVNKQLHTGINQIGGEWGHNCVPATVYRYLDGDRQCYCGRSNCIETVLSGRGLAMTYQQLCGTAATAEEISIAAQDGDSGATACLARYCEQMAECLATVVNLLDPDMIVLGGGLSNIPQLYEQVPPLLGKIVFTDNMRTQLRAAQFGDASGARGAACLWPA